jgi:hypothetical protein
MTAIIKQQPQPDVPQPYASPLLAPTGQGVGAAPALTPRSNNLYLVAPMAAVAAGPKMSSAPAPAPSGKPQEEGAEMWNSVSSSILASMLGSALGFGAAFELIADLMLKTAEAGEEAAVDATGLAFAVQKGRAMHAASPGLRTAESMALEEEAKRKAGDSNPKERARWSVGGTSMAAGMNARRQAMPSAPTPLSLPRPGMVAGVARR